MFTYLMNLYVVYVYCIESREGGEDEEVMFPVLMELTGIQQRRKAWGQLITTQHEIVV